MHAQRRMREEPPIVQQIPNSVPHETLPTRGMSLRKALSNQNLAQIETPWEGVTLNRCLLVAITILILTSGCQRLHDFVRGRRDGAGIEPTSTALCTRQAELRRGRLASTQPETSLWETFFWWVADDDHDDDKERRRGKLRKVIRERASGCLRDKPRTVMKQRKDSFKAHRGKMRMHKEESPERVKDRREKDKRPKQKHVEEEQDEIQKKTTKESKTDATKNH
ncbi:uncharacterized protein LOC113584690 [Electrophorus electricus]|uniref:uncharacterized protein LOC113584690 n=1 Tax=Electrophorus electricus TaxID=8005 RepID=UPI0015D07F45|nr:uncharacterized protein LOC113584690 [Electrophorus electricus]